MKFLRLEIYGSAIAAEDELLDTFYDVSAVYSDTHHQTLMASAYDSQGVLLAHMFTFDDDPTSIHEHYVKISGVLELPEFSGEYGHWLLYG